MTEGIKVSLWGKFDEIFPTVTFKIPPKGKKFLYKLYLYWRPSFEVKGWPAGLGYLVSQLLADGQVPLCSVGHGESKPAAADVLTVQAAATGLVQRLLLTPFRKGQTHGHDERYGPSGTIWEVRIRISWIWEPCNPVIVILLPSNFPWSKLKALSSRSGKVCAVWGCVSGWGPRKNKHTSSSPKQLYDLCQKLHLNPLDSLHFCPFGLIKLLTP